MDNNQQNDFNYNESNSRPESYGSNQSGTFRNANGTYHIPVWLIIVGFVLNWLLGLGLLIARLCEDKPSQKGSSQAAGKNIKKKKANVKVILMVLGIFALVGGISLMPYAVQYLIWCIEEGDYISYGVEDVAQALLWILSGIGMILASRHMRAGERRRQKIAAVVGDAESIYIKEISEALSMSREKTMKYVQQCIDCGMFGSRAYLDMRSESLVISGQAPAPLSKDDEKAKEEEERKGENQSKYDVILKQLRDVNDRIPGEEMSAKIDRLENLTGKIFRLLQDHPEKQSKMNKFMDYYLPTSLKLLERYAQLDAQEVEGDNISKSKKQIEETMDTMVTAFEKQLDKMFYAESIDISADIAAMQNMLHVDGLTDSTMFDTNKTKQQ